MKFNGKWLPDDQLFRQECLKIANDLTNFKRNPVYCRFINNDNRPYETAFKFYDHIKYCYPELLLYIDDFKENDLIGNPTLHGVGNHFISPGTLRFIKVVGDISRFGFESVIEIGSGYGGQCFVLKKLYDVPYTLVDIPESLAVAKAYLKQVKLVRFVNSTEVKPISAGLVISDYCLSEMDKDGVDFYLNTVVRYCNNGYFTCNKIGVTDYLLSQLKEIFHQVVVEPEKPKTSKHDNIIVYAMGNRYLC